MVQITPGSNEAGKGGSDAPGADAPPGRLQDVRVLIVDDDADVLESIDAAFQAEGALTQCVMDGNEAVRVCREDPPDVVVLDMMLPRRSGFLVLEKIKGHADSPVVLMVTANEGKRHQAYAESLGVDSYMIKPVPLERLIDRAAAEHAKVGGPRRRDPDRADGPGEEPGNAEQGEAGDEGPDGADGPDDED
jgi:DNA-binding response OmpR family regulator